MAGHIEQQDAGSFQYATAAFWKLFLSFCCFVAVVTESANAQITLPGPGTINTVAGTGTAGFSGDGGLAISATLHIPYGLAVDSVGNIYVADSSNSVIRKIAASTGDISTVAGRGGSPGFVDGPATTTAELNGPASVALDSLGNIYIADYVNNRLRVVNTTSGTITIAGTQIQAGYVGTVAGNGTAAESGDGQPAKNLSELNGPTGVALDAAGNIYIVDEGGARVRAINPKSTGTVTVATIQIPAGYINTVAGGTTVCSGHTDGIGDGCPATQAQLGAPTGVALDSTGNIYIADPGANHFDVRKVTASTGIISLFAGDGTGGFSGDAGLATLAELESPNRLAIDAAGNVYIADSNAPSIRIRMVVASTGKIYSIAGNGTPCTSPTTSCGDGGAATSAELNDPVGVAVDSHGDVYVGDSSDNRVRVVGGGVHMQGGTLTGSSSGMSDPGASITLYDNISGTLGTVSFSTGSLSSGTLQNGGTFSGGGSVVVTTNGANGTHNGVDFSGSFSGTVSWSLVTLANGTHQYTLKGPVADGLGHSGTLAFSVNTNRTFFTGSSTNGGGFVYF